MTNCVEIFRDQSASRLLTRIIPNELGWESWSMFPYQERAYKDWDSQYLCGLPTGAGKSLIIKARAAENRRRGVSTFIIAPKRAISQAFQISDVNHKITVNGTTLLLKDGEILYLDGADGSISTKITERLFNYARRDQRRTKPAIGCITVSCYESFRIAYQNVRDQLDPARVEVIIDECHHVDLGWAANSNQLGQLCKMLSEDGVAHAGFSATPFRSVGRTMSDGSYKVHQRTLIEHYDEGFCPDLSIHFQLYDTVSSSDYDKYEATGDELVVTSSADKLLQAYKRVWLKAPTRPHLMIIPARVQTVNGKELQPAEIACDLQQKLLATGKIKPHQILNLGWGESGGLVSENKRDYSVALDKLRDEKQRKRLRVIISIKIMDEGVDWPECREVFMPGVPQSMALNLQRIGRATRRPPMTPKIKSIDDDDGRHAAYEKHCKNQNSNVHYFELGIKKDDKDIPRSLVKIAVRLEALFHGIEFKEPFSLTTKRHSRRLGQKLVRANRTKLYAAIQSMLQECMDTPSQQATPRLLQKLGKSLKKAGIDLAPHECLELYATHGVIDMTQFSRKQRLSLVRLSRRSRDFRQFCEYPEIKGIIDSLTLQAPTQFAGLLSGKSGAKLREMMKCYAAQNGEAQAIERFREIIAKYKTIDGFQKDNKRLTEKQRSDYQWRSMMRHTKAGKGPCSWHPVLDEIAKEHGWDGFFDVTDLEQQAIERFLEIVTRYKTVDGFPRNNGHLSVEQHSDLAWRTTMRRARAGKGKYVWYPVLDEIAKENVWDGFFDTVDPEQKAIERFREIIAKYKTIDGFPRGRVPQLQTDQRSDCGWRASMRQAKAGKGTCTWYPVLDAIAKEYGWDGFFDIIDLEQAVIERFRGIIAEYKTIDEFQRNKSVEQHSDHIWRTRMRDAKVGKGNCRWYPVLDEIAKENGWDGFFDTVDPEQKVIERFLEIIAKYKTIDNFPLGNGRLSVEQRSDYLWRRGMRQAKAGKGSCIRTWYPVLDEIAKEHRWEGFFD